MTALHRPLAALALLAALACEPDRSPTALGSLLASAQNADAASMIAASGGGHYVLPGALAVQFAFTAVQTPHGTATGEFHIYLDEGDGLTVDVSGTVICMSQDAVNHRAWIGALVTKNRSTDPDLLTEDHEVGDDVWFRVLDSGEGDGAVDRTTFTGFKGAAGFNTSPEYCAGMPWPDGNARTWPVTGGNISVRP